MLTIDVQNAIVERAKAKKDGCYTYKGVHYLVKNGGVRFYATRGTVLQAVGMFNSAVGNYTYEPYDIGGDQGKKTLLQLMKEMLN